MRQTGYNCEDITEALIRNGEYFLLGPTGMHVVGKYATTGPYSVKRTKTMFLSRDKVDIEALVKEAKGVSK